MYNLIISRCTGLAKAFYDISIGRKLDLRYGTRILEPKTSPEYDQYSGCVNSLPVPYCYSTVVKTNMPFGQMNLAFSHNERLPFKLSIYFYLLCPKFEIKFPIYKELTTKKQVQHDMSRKLTLKHRCVRKRQAHTAYAI